MVHLGILHYRCSKCDYSAYRKDTVQQHCKSHKDLLAVPLRISCNLCSEGFECKHQGIKRKKCSEKINKKNRKPPIQLNRKPVVWSFPVEKDKEETYLCKNCELLPPFETVKSIRSHYRMFHPDKFIYHCSESKCSYGTNYFTNLKVHRNSRHEKINQTCDQCGYKTLWRSVLLRHLREQHGAIVYESKSIS